MVKPSLISHLSLASGSQIVHSCVCPAGNRASAFLREFHQASPSIPNTMGVTKRVISTPEMTPMITSLG